MDEVYDGWPDIDAATTCRRMLTRRCPGSYGEQGCGEQRPCARFESDDPTPWLATPEQ